MSKRLDVYLTDSGICKSRQKAQEQIKSGNIFVNGSCVIKPSFSVDEQMTVENRGESLKYVSRGGLKLEKAIESFDIRLSGLVCADIGASTGGFTDCMLQNGAKKVYAVDVGTDQLADVLKKDSRVVNLEKTNFRNITENEIVEALDFASVDVSFISLKIILPKLFTLLKDESYACCLIKPQFEAGRENIGKNGVVKDRKIHEKVIDEIRGYALSIGFSVMALDYSPIKGPQGNIEYLILLKKGGELCDKCRTKTKDLVANSHSKL